MNVQDAVMEFHRVYGVPVGWQPQALSRDRLMLRLRLIEEEREELLQASGLAADGRTILSNHQDIIEMADALGDIVYVCFGMAIEMGIDLNRVIAEIQRANLSKLGEDGKPIINECITAHCGNKSPCMEPGHRIDSDLPQGKVLKGPNYRPPDIKAVLDSQPPLTGEFG